MADPQEIPDAKSFYDTLTALEGRLRDSIEAKFKEVKEMFASQQARQDELVRTLATRSEMNEVLSRVTKLEVQLQDHAQLDGHTGGLARLKHVEEDLDDLKGRPLRAWQIVTAVAFVLLSVGGFILNLLSFFHVMGH